MHLCVCSATPRLLYAARRYEAERDGDHRALRALRAKEMRLELRRARKNLFIQAVSEATDFKKVPLGVLKVVVLTSYASAPYLRLIVGVSVSVATRLLRAWKRNCQTMNDE